MKNQFVIALFLLSVCISCKEYNSRVAKREQQNELLKQYRENSVSLSDQDSLGGNRTDRFLRKGNRTVDTLNPPVIINLPESGTYRELKLSDFASTIKYIRLAAPPDSTLLYDSGININDLNSKIISDGEQIIFQGLFGLTRFSMDGRYLETIWKNNTGIKILGNTTSYGGNDFYGVPAHVPVSLSKGVIYYTLSDGPESNFKVIRYKPDNSGNLSQQPQNEMPSKEVPKGEILFTSPKMNEYYSYTFGINSDTWTGINNKWISGRSGSMAAVCNISGDTVCQFADFDRIKQFSSTNFRKIGPSGFIFNGLITIKQAFNDTVFRLITPERLLPVYIIRLGNENIGGTNGLNPGYDLSDKYLLRSLYETDKYLFIGYTQNYDSKVNRLNKKVKFYTAIYSKKDKHLYLQTGFMFSPDGIKNDIDGGLPFWPDHISEGGQMMKLVSGKMILDFIHSAKFRQSAIPGNKSRLFTIMASELKPTDMVIMMAY